MPRIRWLGHPAPLESPVIRKLLLSGRAPRPFVDTLSEFEKNYRLEASPGRSTFWVGPAHGFSRTYQWGPHEFEQEMDEADWHLLRRHPLDRVMFQDVTDGAFWPAPQLSGGEWEDLMRVYVTTQKPRALMQVGG